jgi:hypothetical protein
VRTRCTQIVTLNTTPWSAPVVVDWVLTPPWGMMRAIRARASSPGRFRRYQEARGALVGSGYVVSISVQDKRVTSYSTPRLIGACALIGAITMLFTTPYPLASFDCAVGMNRWALPAAGLCVVND